MATQLKVHSAAVSQPEPEALIARAAIDEKGRLVIPAAIREALALEAGDAIDMRVQDHELRLSTREGRLLRAQERARLYSLPGTLISDELIAERRAEALAE